MTALGHHSQTVPVISEQLLTEQTLHHTPLSYLREMYETWQRRLNNQPAAVTQYLAAQAAILAEAITQQSRNILFGLPSEVVIGLFPDGGDEIAYIASEERAQQLGKLTDHARHSCAVMLISQHLTVMEQSHNPAIAIAAGLLRHVTARYMVHDLLPAGQPVTYRPAEGDVIPCHPADVGATLQPALVASASAATAEEIAAGRVQEHLSSYTNDARSCFLPQWIAFDLHGRLLVSTVGEAQAFVQSMQRYVQMLHDAVSLAPYFVSDDTYQAKRYGILGQLVNQGRALAHFEAHTDIQLVKQRVDTNNLNRGLSLSLPYFDDQALKVRLYEFEVIPAGRITFLPSYVVHAAMAEQVRVAQDLRLSPSTRKHLLSELKELEVTFTAVWDDSNRYPNPMSEI